MKGTRKFDFRKRGRSIDDVRYAEQEAALYVLMGHLTKILTGKTETGAFSVQALGRPAVEHFSEIAMIKVFTGRWTWKEETKLTTLLCNCAESEMAHWVRKWRAKQAQDKVEPQPASSLYDPDKVLDGYGYDPEKDEALSDEERAAADEQEEQERVIGYEEALEIVKDDPRLVKFVKAVHDLETCRQIEKRLKITVAEYDELEAELLKRLKVESRMRPPTRWAVQSRAQ